MSRFLQRRASRVHTFETVVMLGPVLLLGSLGCASDQKDGGQPPTIGASSEVSIGDDAVASEPPDSGTSATSDSGATAEAERCTPGPGATGSPGTIVEVVELINSLPMPVTIPCLLQSLDRPIALVATSSVISAQPANGQDNPRLFLLGDGISLSVVPSGDSSHLLELGELVSNTRSVKGELAFPVTEPLPLTAPFEHIERVSGGTVCYVCHSSETAAESYPVEGAFESTAYRPVPRLEINFDYVEYQYTVCDFAAEPDRCAFFAALFDQGQVSRGEFPQDMPTFD